MMCFLVRTQVACFVMVFASIVEYAAVSYIGNLRPSKKKVRPRPPLPSSPLSTALSGTRSGSSRSKLAPTTATATSVFGDGGSSQQTLQQHRMLVQQTNGDGSTSRPTLVIANSDLIALTLQAQASASASAAADAGGTAAVGKVLTASAQSCNDIWRTAADTTVTACTFSVCGRSGWGLHMKHYRYHISMRINPYGIIGISKF